MNLLRQIVTTAALLLVGSCDAPEREFPPYRYRLTVEVQTPEGVRRGSTVIEVQRYRQGPIPSSTIVSRAEGVAVAVDLGARGRLFTLMASPNDYQWAENIMAHLANDLLPSREVDRVSPPRTLIMIPRMLPERWQQKPMSGYPYMAHFRNPKDWESLELVNPDDLEASFGEGVKLIRLTAQFTNDAVTTQVLATVPRPSRKHSAADVRKLRTQQEAEAGRRSIGIDYFVRHMGSETLR